MFWSRSFSFVLVTASALAIISSTLASETQDSVFSGFLTKRVVSPDNTCGNVVNGANDGYSCDATVNDGGCCVSFFFRREGFNPLLITS